MSLKRSWAVRSARKRINGVPDPLLNKLSTELKLRTGADAGFVSFITDDKQFVVGNDGIPPEGSSPEGTDLGLSFCAALIREPSEGLVVENTRDFPLLEFCPTTAIWGAWVGAPVRFRGEKIGAVGVTAAKPRRWAQDTLAAVQQTAAAVEFELND